MYAAENLILELLDRGHHIDLLQHIREYRFNFSHVYIDFHSQILLRLASCHVESMANFGIKKSDRVRIIKDKITIYSNPDYFDAWITSGCPGVHFDELNSILIKGNKRHPANETKFEIEHIGFDLLPELPASRNFIMHGGANLLLDLIESEKIIYNSFRKANLDEYSKRIFEETKNYLKTLSQNDSITLTEEINNPFYDAWILSRTPGISIDKMFNTWNLIEF